MRDFIERLRAKPEHVRKQIALGTSAGVTGVVALGWFVAFAASGALTVTPPDAGTIADTEVGSTVAEARTGFSELLGAASAFTGSASADPELEIVETHTSSTIDPAPTTDTRTVIPF